MITECADHFIMIPLIILQNKPLYIGVDDSRSVSTCEGLEQGYCVVPGDKRFLLLFTFLKKNMNKKVREWRAVCTEALCVVFFGTMEEFLNNSHFRSRICMKSQDRCFSLVKAFSKTYLILLLNYLFLFYRSWFSFPHAIRLNSTLSC